MTLSIETKEAILNLQKHYPHKRSAILPALHMAQGEKGFLCRKTQNEVAELFDMDPNEVNAIVAFYDMFFDHPVGKHRLHVCKNLSCMLRGSDELISALCRKLNIQPHETTTDGNFTVIPSECLGACDQAPMMLADDRVFGLIKTEDLDAILEEVKKGKGNASPISPSEVPHE